MTDPAARRPAPQGVLVRPSREAELDRAGEVVALAYRDDGLLFGDYLDVVADARARSRAAQVLVAVVEEEVVGTITVAHAPSPWVEVGRPGETELRMLGVAPVARGLGIGPLLVRAGIAAARERGSHRVVLCTATSMDAAQRLYRRLGFERLPDRDWQPESGVDLLGYGLALG